MTDRQKLFEKIYAALYDIRMSNAGTEQRISGALSDSGRLPSSTAPPSGLALDGLCGG
jgi:hypothetical protein